MDRHAVFIKGLEVDFHTHRRLKVSAAVVFNRHGAQHHAGERPLGRADLGLVLIGAGPGIGNQLHDAYPFYGSVCRPWLVVQVYIYYADGGLVMSRGMGPFPLKGLGRYYRRSGPGPQWHGLSDNADPVTLGLRGGKKDFAVAELVHQVDIIFPGRDYIILAQGPWIDVIGTIGGHSNVNVAVKRVKPFGPASFVRHCASLKPRYLRHFIVVLNGGIDHLKELGAEIVYIDSISDKKLPDIDGLYIGGGFPEVCAEELSNNRSFRESLKNMIENNLPVYAECGGLIYLGQSLEMNGNSYPMAGALPITFIMEEKPQGHGYTILKVKRENPYYSIGETIRGHEFHYSRPVISETGDIKTVFEVERGHCLDGTRDGFIKNNLFATYTHIHSAGNRSWGEGFIRAAREYRELVKKNTKI